MQLEDYFVFEETPTKFGTAETIKIKGHRIAIEHVIELFNQGEEPGVIQREHYPTLTLEEVYATVTYYLHNKAEVDAYIQRGEDIAEAFYQEHLKQGPSPIKERILALQDKQQEDARGNNG